MKWNQSTLYLKGITSNQNPAARDDDDHTHSPIIETYPALIQSQEMSIERDILDALILLLGGTIGRRVPGLSYLGENITNYN